MVKLGNDWDNILLNEFEKEYYQNLRKFLIEEYKKNTVYPHMDNIFSALKLTSYKDCKVLLLGQDPYHGPNQAHGLAFSVNPEIKSPPSLVNMYKELKAEYGYDIPNNGYLVPWATQGVLLLNTALTVRKGEPNSHANIGWELFTDNIIKKLNERIEPVIFILWGANARKKVEFINRNKHFILEAPHPSPFSANKGFFGCNHFKEVNNILKKLGKEEINWKIENI
ncbi:uracil-DNA glycosylase [Fusobacterium sp. PH5-44]|uniref:uracil-DNA glycosylase n=1 Tax=unclassified Fusobacterium TaxID=2648384 RepID=UPI003D1DD9EC